MTAMFPASGVPASDALNSLPNPATANCNPLWYSTSRCTPRFDPAAANAMLAELVNLINKGEVTYDCTHLDQVQQSVRYLIQRGLPLGAVLYGGPFAYTAALDPTATRYNDFMTLVFVPGVKNQGAVTIDLNGLGARQVVRNDGQQLLDGDLLPGAPTLLSFWNTQWHMVGLAASQVPLVVQGSVDLWIRTDGNDATGDGSANSADKAFKTIAGAWNRAGSRYASTPLFSINMRLGIPGTYDGAVVGNFGGDVRLHGDVTNRAGYRIKTFTNSGNFWYNLVIGAIGQFLVEGVTFVLDHPTSAAAADGIHVTASVVNLLSCDFELTRDLPAMNVISVSNGGTVGLGEQVGARGQFYFIGNGFKSKSLVYVTTNSTFQNSGVIYGSQINIDNWHMVNSTFVTEYLGVIGLYAVLIPAAPTVTGMKYSVAANSIISANGQPIPGDVAGVASSGGQFIP